MSNISSLGSINFSENPTGLYNFALPIDTVTEGGSTVTKKISLEQVRQYILNSTTSYATPSLTVDSKDITLCTNQGFVGIGTSNPLTKLHVAGKAYVDGELTVTGFINGTVETAKAANKLTTGRTFTVTGAVTAAAATFDGQRNIALVTGLTPDIVTSAAIADSSIGNEHLQPGAIQSTHIANEQISQTHVGLSSLSGDRLVDASVDISKLSPVGSVTAGEYTTPVVTVNSSGIITAIATSAGLDVSSIYPQQLYVSTGGSETTANGSINLPYHTISAALSAISSTDDAVAILVQPGTYVEDIVVTRPNTHIIGLNVANNFSSVIVDGEVLYNIDTQADDDVSTISNLTLLNNSTSTANLLVLSGTATQSIILSEVGIRDDGISTSSNNQIIYCDNSSLSLHLNNVYAKSATIWPVVWINEGNATITNSTIIATHATDGSGVQFDTGTVGTIDRCNITTTDESGVVLNGDANVDITYSTIRGTLSNSTGVSLASGSKLTAINNIFNVKRGSGFAIKAVDGSVLSHAFNTYLDNQSVLSGLSAAALPTTFALVTAAEFAVEITTPIFDVISVTVKRSINWSQEGYVAAPVLSAHSPHTFQALLCTDSTAVTSVNLLVDENTEYALVQSGTGFEHLSSDTDHPAIDDYFARTSDYTLNAATDKSITTSATINTIEETDVLETIAETDLSNLTTSYTVTVTNSGLSALSSADAIPLEIRLSINHLTSERLISDFSFDTLQSNSVSAFNFWNFTVPENTNEFLSGNIGIDSSLLSGDAATAWNTGSYMSPVVYRTNTGLVTAGPAYEVISKSGKAEIILDATCLSGESLSNSLTSGWYLSAFDTQALPLSDYSMETIMESLTTLDGTAQIVFDYTDNSDQSVTQVAATFALSTYDPANTVNLLYDFAGLENTGTLSLNTTAYHTITQVTTLSTIELSSAPLTSLSYSDEGLLTQLGTLTGGDNTVTFSVDISSNALTAVDGVANNLPQNLLMTPDSGEHTVSMNDIFTSTLLSEGFDTTSLEDLASLSGTATFEAFTTVITETSALSSSQTPVSHTFTLSSLGSVADTRPAVAFTTIVDEASAIPAGSDFDLIIDPLSSPTDTGADIKVSLDINDTVIYSGTVTEEISTTGAIETQTITSIKIPQALLSTANTELTGTLKTFATLSGSSTILGIPVEFIEENTLIFNLSVTDPIYIPVACQFETIIISVQADGDGNLDYYIDGIKNKDINLGRNKLYMVVLSSPWLSSSTDPGINGNHPLDFSSTDDGTHGAGNSLTTGISGTSATPWNKSNGETAHAITPGGDGFVLLDTSNAGLSDLDALYYFCNHHAGMGGKMTFHDECSSSVLSGTAAFDVLSTSAPATIALSAFYEEGDPEDEFADDEGFSLVFAASGAKQQTNNSEVDETRWTYSNELCTLGAPVYMFLGWDNTYTFQFMDDYSDIFGQMFISEVKAGTLRDYIMNGQILQQTSWPLGDFGTLVSDTYVTNQSAADGSMTLTTNYDLEPYTRDNANEEPLLVLHSLSGGSGTYPGSTGGTSTSGISALTASNILAVFRFRNWATGNYMSYSHSYVTGNPGSDVTPGTSY